jgi:hypothetical protein
MQAMTATCPSCGGSVGVYAPAVSLRVTCQHCASLLGIRGDTLVYADSLAKQILWKGSFPIGSTATIEGVVYTLVGYVFRDTQVTPNTTRGDGAKGYWYEYMLYNPTAGVRWLANVPRRRRNFWWWDGMIFRWYFLEPLSAGAAVPVTSTTVSYKGSTFRRRDWCEARVRGLEGEFDRRVTVGQRSDSIYYMREAEMVAFEQTNGELSWQFGRAVPGKAVERAFDPKTGAENPIALDDVKAARTLE